MKSRSRLSLTRVNHNKTDAISGAGDASNNTILNTSVSLNQIVDLSDEVKVVDCTQSNGRNGSDSLGFNQSDNGSVSEAGEGATTDDSTTAGDGVDNSVTSNVPYYVEYFATTVNEISADSMFEHLFNEEERNTVTTFAQLSEPCKQLYVRLILRKWRWLRTTDISYPDIAADLTDILRCLVQQGFLTDSSQLSSLSDALEVLPAPQLRTLAHSLHMTHVGVKQVELRTAIVRQTEHSRGIAKFLTAKSSVSLADRTLTKVKELIGACYKLEAGVRSMFMRMLCLASLPSTVATDDDDNKRGSQLIFQLLMNRVGDAKYPAYTIRRTVRIFRNRENLISFCDALQAEHELVDMVARQQDKQVTVKLIHAARQSLERIYANCDTQTVDLALPAHLRVFTAGCVYTRILSAGVDVVQSTEDWAGACELLQWLLDRHVYCQTYRGRWYDRLALNLERYMKQPAQCMEVIRKALDDDLVVSGHRLSLLQRARRLCQSASHKQLHQHMAWLQLDHMSDVQDVPSVTVRGQQLFQGQSGNSRWLSKVSQDGAGDSSELMSVEQVALTHYRHSGYDCGFHGEGSPYVFLFSLFFWDILFHADVPDVFIVQFQTAPLDLTAGRSFYEHRKLAIDARLAEIASFTHDQVMECILSQWQAHEGTQCVGASWDLFPDSQHAADLACCMGGHVLSGIFRRLACNFRSCTGGLPDLIVWNRADLKWKAVEVKGPGDRLSTKQQLWLHYLRELGADVEVCHVQAVGAKRLASSSMSRSQTVEKVACESCD